MVKRTIPDDYKEDKVLGDEKGLIDPDPGNDNPREVVVALKFNLDTEKLEIDSGFKDTGLAFKDPIGYTTHLLQMALEKWIREEVGMICPGCSIEMAEDWDYCPKCGYTLLEEEDVQIKSD